MRQPLRAKAPRAQIASVFSSPAPIGGWNAFDSLANMPMTDAWRLINWFPTTVDVRMRGGNTVHSTGISGTVETLAVYNKMDGTSKMFAITDYDAYDVTSEGAAAAQSVTVSDGKFQTLNYGDGSNNYLMMFNGVDKPLFYNGSAWVSVDSGSTPAIAGVTTTSLIQANEYKGRLIFIEKNSLSFWYLPSGSAGGTVIEFDLSSYCKRGGYLMWCATWSFDGGDGPDDACVFMTSEGEVIVYRGTDPSTAANWVLAGVYFLGKPIGRRSYVKYGGDLVAITQNGAYPLSVALQSANINNTFALTNKIENAFNEASRSYGSNFGWEAVVYPAQSAILFNIPVKVGSNHKQYVMNTITKSWCEFNSWNAECFAEFNKELYFGSSSGVNKAWTGNSDNGSDIVAIGKQAFNYFGNTSQEKRFTLFRPMIQTNGSITFGVGLDVDFSDITITGTTTYTIESSIWDVGLWDVAKWSGGLQSIRVWSSPSNNVGYAASGLVKITTDSFEVRWISSDYVYEGGGVL